MVEVGTNGESALHTSEAELQILAFFVGPSMVSRMEDLRVELVSFYILMSNISLIGCFTS